MAPSLTSDQLSVAQAQTQHIPQTQVSLAGKVIAITGANRGIGLSITECCLSNGAAKVYSINIGETGDDFAAVLKRYPGQIFAINVNMTEESTITTAIDKIIKEAGALHGMVVNTGRTHYKAALDFIKEEIESLFNVNLFGVFYSARVAARVFIKLGIKGSIVFTASMASYRLNKRVLSTLYGASKAGVRNMTHTLAMEWAQYLVILVNFMWGLLVALGRSFRSGSVTREFY